MSSDPAIGAPYTLATLSKPINFTHGRVHAAGVCSISGVKKRKRLEIAVGLSGEGVFIYTVQTPHLITSYALPQDALLTTAPYSIYRKGIAKTQSHRFTYVSVAGTTSADTSQIVCFHERSLGENTETVKTSYKPAIEAQLLTLDSLPVAASASSQTPTHDLLAIFNDGHIICLSADLRIVRWVSNLNPLLHSGQSAVKPENVSLANAKAVTRGLLRSREDVAAILNPTSDEASHLLELTQVLCVIGRKSNGARTLTLLHIQPRSADLTTSHLSPLKHLISWSLPIPSKIALSASSVPQIALHVSSGVLHMLVEGALLSYNFSATVPKLYSELLFAGESVNSFIRTSQDMLFTTSPHMCRVFDVKYNSLQAFLSLDSPSSVPDSSSPSKKRKHMQPEVSGSSLGLHRLIAYYADIGLMVAVRENEIFGMQFGGIVTRKRAKTEGILLIDALGKGIDSKSAVDPSRDAHKWQERKAKLDRYVAKGNIAKFEGGFAADLGIQLESSETEQKRANEVNGGPLTNGIGPKIFDVDLMSIDEPDEPVEDELRQWKIPNFVPDTQRHQYRQYALYALNCIFSWTSTDASQAGSRGSLKMDFFPPNIFQWLLQTGYFTKESIWRSLQQADPLNTGRVFAVKDGDITKALVEFDPNLHILSAVLNHSHFLPVGEVVQSIRLLVQNLNDEPEETEATGLVTDGAGLSEDELDVDITSELDAATHEIDHALSVLDHGLLVRSHTLRPALIRLHTFSAPVVSSTLRSMLPRRDLESLIRLLHLEMKNGGWTSTYDFVNTDISTDDISREDPDDHAVTIIASLLSSALDAIGAGAWLTTVRSSTAESSEEIIQSLHNDTSEALNGFWEARYMRGLLAEFLRYASTLPNSRKPSNKALEIQGKPFIVDGKLDSEQDLPILPLGGKADLGVDKMKKGLGGQKEERSKREIGMLISKRVPKYSFERIVI